jgi:hypothetical protein
MAAGDLERDSQRGLPQGYRQGLVTAITVFLGFSLSFTQFWHFEAGGEWTAGGAVAAGIVAVGIVLQLVALYRALELRDDEPGRYAGTVRWFFLGISVVVAGVLVATVVA